MAKIKAGSYIFNAVLNFNNTPTVTSEADVPNAVVPFAFHSDFYGAGDVHDYVGILVGASNIEGYVVGQCLAYVANSFLFRTVYGIGNEYYDGQPYPMEQWSDDPSDTRRRTIRIDEEQTVPDWFGLWFSANTNYREVNGIKTPATITYNGTTTPIEAGKTATLPCNGKVMKSDVVFKVDEVSGGGGNIVPLYVGSSGTFNTESPYTVTETFSQSSDFTETVSAELFGMPLTFGKAKKLVCPVVGENVTYEDIVRCLSCADYKISIDLSMGGEETKIEMPLATDGALANMDGIPLILIETTDNNAYNAKAFTFYVFDFFAFAEAMDAPCTGTISVTGLGYEEGKKIDGFCPVVVNPPSYNFERLDLTIQDIGVVNDGYYNRVVLNHPETETKEITPSSSDITVDTFLKSQNKVIDKVVVKAVDISQISMPIGIYLSEYPKTEYKIGDYLDTVGGVIAVKSNGGSGGQVGSTWYINLTNDNVWGFSPAMEKGVGKHILTVKYTHKGIEMQTTYQITITE